MPTLAIRASYAPLINLFVSREETRYYLTGFYSHPCDAGGVNLVATDGRRMGIFREEEGFIDGNGIWPLRDETLRACKRARDDKKKIRWLVIAPADPEKPDGTHRVSIVLTEPFSKASSALELAASDLPDLVPHIALVRPIDGTFPDYTRVMPKEMPTEAHASWFNHRYLETFFKVAASGDAHAPSICVHNTAPTEPTIILAGARPDFMGVIMPMRGGMDAGKFPAWWNAAPAAQAAE